MISKTKPEILKQNIVAQSRIFTIDSLQLKFSNGEERVYERIRGADRASVMILPITDNNEFVLIREYGAGTHRYEMGFPKGNIDPGETPEQAANRELQEEADYQAKELTIIKSLALSPSYIGHQTLLVLARQLSPAQAEGDEPEPLDIIHWPVEKTAELLQQDDFSDARSIAAASMYFSGLLNV